MNIKRNEFQLHSHPTTKQVRHKIFTTNFVVPKTKDSRPRCQKPKTLNA